LAFSGGSLWLSRGVPALRPRRRCCVAVVRSAGAARQGRRM